MNAALLVDCRCELGEGLVWSVERRAWLWTDIERSQLWMYDPELDHARHWSLPERLGSFALCTSGKLLLALAKRLALVELDLTRADGRELSVNTLATVESDLPTTRTNDGRTDRAGNFVFGTMNEAADGVPLGSFYQYSAKHGLRQLALGGIVTANSICFSLDGRTMFYCDSRQRRIMVCDYDAGSARVANIREFVDFGDLAGGPDGSIIDADGHLWNAGWGAAKVRRFAPDGSIACEIDVPAKNVTCPAFGGSRLEELCVTTARRKMSAAELEAMPDAGGVFGVVPDGVRGVTDALFNDRV
jgi:sugar lactone lactonase YvrE